MKNPKGHYYIKLSSPEIAQEQELVFEIRSEEKITRPVTVTKWQVTDDRGQKKGTALEYKGKNAVKWIASSGNREEPLSPGRYSVSLTVDDGCEERELKESFDVVKLVELSDSEEFNISPDLDKVNAGGELDLEVSSEIPMKGTKLTNGEYKVRWELKNQPDNNDVGKWSNRNAPRTRLSLHCLPDGEYTLSVFISEKPDEWKKKSKKIKIESSSLSPKEIRETIVEAKDLARDLIGRLGGSSRSVSLMAEPPEATPIKTLFKLIRDRSRAISFESYSAFMDRVMHCNDQAGAAERAFRNQWDAIARQGFHVFQGPDAYTLLRECTQFFLMQECGIDHQQVNPRANEELRTRIKRFDGMSDQQIQAELDRNRDEYLQALEAEGDIRVLPYFRAIRQSLRDIPLKHPDQAPNCYGILRSRIANPCFIELIWSYWHEEAMLVQALNVISLRFQNRHSGVYRDQLANMDIDPLRPLNNLLWGYIQDEQHRLTLMRRNYEYDHHYGIRLNGKAVKKLNPVDSRSRFLEAFHNLLHLCSVYFKDSADTTVRPDGFPLLNALKEVNLLLTEGMHNQFGDLPWTARVEMMVQQWLLARPEIRNFLGGRTMVPYPEEWMRNLDTLNKMQGWAGGVTVRHYRDLADFGEQILLSIRYGNWSNINNENDARLWAEFWRQELQGYIHSYRAVTGVDLTAEPVDYAMPSQHLQRRTNAVL